LTVTVVCADGALTELPKLLMSHHCRHAFLVTGRTSYRSSGAEAALAGYLAPYTVTIFSDVDENPKLEQLEFGLRRFREANADLVIGVGGGSVLDMAKLIKIFAAQPKAPVTYVDGPERLLATTLPLVAIPTTAGSGSQATHFAVLYIGKTKYSVTHLSMLPDDALVDPSLLKSVPPTVAASTGLDALNQGIESYWSIHSTDVSKSLASEAIELVWEHLYDVVQQPSNKSRLAMAIGAHRAGEAINITKTTAPHAISYPITSHFGVPHGHAVGLVLARVLLFNASVSVSDCLDCRGTKYVQDTIANIAKLFGEDDASGAARAYNKLMDAIGLSRDFRSLGIRSRADLETIIMHGFNPQRVNNNPRRLTESALRNILVELQVEA
jgi:alcohol dehydrogenase class IV